MFCRIYINRKEIDRDALQIGICSLLGAEIIGKKYIEKEGYSIEIRANEEYNKSRELLFPDGFLFFPLTIEFDIQDDISVEKSVEEIGKVLRFLWEKGYTAIASCDFEDLLPENGGYKSRNIPWNG